MTQKEARVKSQYGIHARPSMVIAIAASKDFPDTEIVIINNKNDQHANARSIIELMEMTLPCGALVTVYTSGDREEEAAEAIVKIIESYEVEVK